MPIEIEHKYSVKPELWKQVVPEKSVEIKQAYLSTDPDKTIRVRTLGNKGYITVKSKPVGSSRAEYEYEIPLVDAQEMIERFGFNTIEKTRHYVTYNNKLWEVDEFSGLNIGLLMAEIELKSEDEVYNLPEWVNENISNDPRYANSNLVLKPYTTWQ